VLARYSEPFVVVRKAKRELKAGAQLFARFRTRPALPELPERTPDFVKRTVEKVTERLSRVSRLQENLIRFPSTGNVIDEMGKEFKVQETLILDTLAVPLTLTGGWLDLPVDRLSELVNRLDSKVPQRVREFAGGVVAVFAIKEKELGRTFSLR
jgi:hypothetical protein